MRLIIVGAGGHGQAVREVASALRKYVTADGNENILFLDDRYRDAVNKEDVYKRQVLSCNYAVRI